MNGKREGTLIVCNCHGVYSPNCEKFYGEHPEDRPVYDAHLFYAFKHLEWQKGSTPLLVVSGGPSKPETELSESETYLGRAIKLGLQVTDLVALEKYALTTVENLLFSLYVYHQLRTVYPARIDLVSWSFKAARSAKALEAISAWAPLGESWPAFNFFPVGDLWGQARERALVDETSDIEALGGGIEAYYSSERIQKLIEGRDPHHCREEARKIYVGYPLPF